MNKQYKIFFGTISNHLNNHKSKKEELKRLLKSKKRIMELCEENKIVIDKIREILDRVDELDESEFDELFETDKYAEELWNTIKKYKDDIESCLNKETTLNKETVTLKEYYKKIYDLYQIDCNNIDIEISNIDLVIAQLADISLDPNINTESLSTLYSAANKLNTLLDEFVSHIDNFYTESEANEHNANLEGAVKAGDIKDPEELYTEETANEYNATLEGAIHAGDKKYDTEYRRYKFYVNAAAAGISSSNPDNIGEFDRLSIDENNLAKIKIVTSDKNDAAGPTGAIHVQVNEIYHVQFPINGTEKVNNKWQPGTKLFDENNEAIIVNNGYFLWINGTDITEYTEEEANEHNATLEGAKHEGDQVVYTQQMANEYNATLPGAVKEGDPKVQQNQSDKK